jgi:hypothetical protein
MTTPAVAGTFTIRSGQVLVVPATLNKPDGTPLVLTGAVVAFQMFPSAGGNPLVNAAATILNPLTGAVVYTGTAADTAAAGEFVAYFVVTFPGVVPVAYPADGITIAIYPAIGALTGPQVGPCFPWTTPDAVRGAVAGIDPLADLTEWIEAASEVLYALTGRQFKGLCRATIRPGHEGCSCGGHCSAHAFGWPFLGGFGLYGGGGYYGSYGVGTMYRGQEGPRNLLLCASEIDLGHEARSVESIKIDGIEIDPATWRLDPLGKLVRQPDASGNRLVWPCCQRVDLPSGSVGTFEVRYLYGLDPPASVVMAVNVLAGQFWLGSNPGSAGQCKLPAHVQTMTRQGVTATFITDVSVILEKGYTGLPVVDQVIAAFNPNHLTRRARVISIDVEPHRRMTP